MAKFRLIRQFNLAKLRRSPATLPDPSSPAPLLQTLLARAEPAGQVAKPSQTVRRALKGGA